MGRNECVRGILQGADNLTDDEIAQVVGELEAKRKRRAKAGKVSGEDRATSADAEGVAKDLELAAMIERRNAKLNQIVYRQLHDDIAKFGADDVGIEAMLAGSNRRVEGARASVDALKRSYEAKYLGGLVHDLKKAGLLQYVQPRFMGIGKGPLDDRIAQELWELREGGTPGASGSKEAQGIAKIIHKYQELSRQDQNAHGAFIRKMDGYIVSQSHDMFRIAKAGKEKWIAEIRPLLDERTFENIGLKGDASDKGRINEFLEFIYKELSTGNFMKAETEAPLIGFKGPANLAKKVSQSRVLHFKGATEWTRYNDTYGTGSLLEAVASGLRHGANTTALLERLGPNPKAMFERVLNDLRKKDQPKRAADRLRGTYGERLFSVVDGSIDIPSNITGAQRSALVRAWQSMASLGQAVLASLPDVGNGAGELAFQGKNFIGALGEQFAGMLGQIVDAGARREAAEMVGVGIDSILRDVAGRMTSADTPGRTMQKLNTLFFKLNLLTQWTTAGERAVSEIMSARLGKLKGKQFDALPDRLRMVLSLYDIKAEDWDLIRFNAMEDFDGRTYVSPELLREGGIDARTARKVETKIRAYFADRTGVAILEGGAREKLYVTGARQAGTVDGEAIRFVMQFKQYGISFVQKVIGRYAQEDRFWSIPGALFKMPAAEAAQFAQLIVTMTGLGYLSMAAKDIAKGREPRDPTRPDTMVAAMAQGGGFGIYADYIFGRVNRFGGGPMETALGPTAGDVGDIVDIFQKSRDYAIGASDNAPDVEAWQFLKNNTPFINLFYTRAALDYLILYHIQESMNPGSLRRMERNLKKDQGQEFILPPSEVAN